MMDDSHVPTSERVLDRLADILFATDEILDLLRTPQTLPPKTAYQVEESVRDVYEQVNELMKRLAD